MSWQSEDWTGETSLYVHELENFTFELRIPKIWDYMDFEKELGRYMVSKSFYTQKEDRRLYVGFRRQPRCYSFIDRKFFFILEFSTTSFGNQCNSDWSTLKAVYSLIELREGDKVFLGKTFFRLHEDELGSRHCLDSMKVATQREQIAEFLNITETKQEWLLKGRLQTWGIQQSETEGENGVEDNCRLVSSERMNFNCIEELFKSGDYSDFEIIVGETVFKAHKAILASKSEFFKNMLSHDTRESRNGSVELFDEPQVILKLLEYIYFDVIAEERMDAIEDSSKSILALLKIADCYSMEDLKNRSEVILSREITTDSAFDIWNFASFHEFKYLKAEAECFLINNLDKFDSEKLSDECLELLQELSSESHPKISPIEPPKLDLITRMACEYIDCSHSLNIKELLGNYYGCYETVWDKDHRQLFGQNFITLNLIAENSKKFWKFCLLFGNSGIIFKLVDEGADTQYAVAEVRLLGLMGEVHHTLVVASRCYNYIPTSTTNSNETLQTQKDLVVDIRLSAHKIVEEKIRFNKDGFKSIFDTGAFSDVIVVSRTKEYKAHRIVLCSRSPFFRRYFNNRKELDLPLKVDLSSVLCQEYNPTAFEEVMIYIYTGQIPTETNFTPCSTNISEETSATSRLDFIIELLMIAIKLELHELEIVYSKHLREGITDELVPKLLEIPHTKFTRCLYLDVCRFALENFSQLSKKESFKSFIGRDLATLPNEIKDFVEQCRRDLEDIENDKY